ncbi:hypothetical protein [Tritonibacter mobilis]|uniref:hypothetical protein n=1 Tax=Tritonibacter mobilis TaxID=379347 RepID=UPI003A5BCCF7
MKARIQNDVAVDVHPAPETAFHPSIAAQFEAVPDEVGLGWRRDAQGTWVAPPEPGPSNEPNSGQMRTSVTRTEYYGLFTPDEEAMIRIAASEQVTSDKLNAADAAEKARLMGVAKLAVMLQRIDALAPTGNVDLGNPQIQAGLDLLVAAGLLTPERKAEIQQGVEA